MRILRDGAVALPYLLQLRVHSNYDEEFLPSILLSTRRHVAQIGINAPQGCGKTTVVESLEFLFGSIGRWA